MTKKIFILLLLGINILSAQSVIIVVIDGIRYTESFGAGATNIPNMWNNLKPLGTIYTNFWNDGFVNGNYTTSTNPGHATIATGIWQDINNLGLERTDSATIFEYYRKEKLSPQTKNYVVVGKNKLNRLTYSYDSEYGVPYRADSASSLNLTDIQVYDSLISIMDNHQPDLIIANFADVDLIAHYSRTDTLDLTDYTNAVKNADSLVYQLWQKIQSDTYYQNNTTLFVTNDHGRHTTNFRHHGDGCEGCQHIMLLALGRYIPQGVVDNSHTDQRDIAPTVAELLNFSMPSAEGTSLLGGTLNFMDVSYSQGWNMISVPLQHNTMLRTDLFPAAVSKAFTYDNGYIEADTLKQSKGYWIKFDNPGLAAVSGLKNNQTIPVNTGWNMIGPFDEAIDTSQITYDSLNIRQSNYWGYNNGYFSEETLQPGKGYWLKVSQNGTLTYLAGLGKTSPGISINHKSRLGKIILEDNSGIISNLFVAVEELDIDINSSPPSPPQGLFEARYISGKIIETLGEEATKIKLISPDYPVRIKVENIEIELHSGIGSDDLNVVLSPGEEYILYKSNSDILQIQAVTRNNVPNEYSLSQNYPNPFNPTTIIKYEIPVVGTGVDLRESSVNSNIVGRHLSLQPLYVKLCVYDILGREIKTLVNEIQSPGIFEIEFNAGDLTSGVYLYRIVAGSFVDVKKMILLR